MMIVSKRTLKVKIKSTDQHCIVTASLLSLKGKLAKESLI